MLRKRSRSLKIRSLFSRFIAHWPAKILALTVALIFFVINRIGNLEERGIEVPMEVLVPAGFVISAPYQEKISFIVKGDRGDAVSEITAEDYHAYVDLSQITRAGQYTMPVQYTRRGTALNSSVFIDSIEPAQASIAIEEKLSKEVTIRADMKGAPRIGYVMTRYGISPERVSISGPSSRIEGIDEITTGPIILSGKSESFTTNVTLLVPDPFIKIDNAEFVEFQSVIREERVQREFADVPVIAINLGSAFVLENEEWLGTMTVEGPRIYLDDVDSLLLQMSVDLSGIGGAGVFQMPVSVSTPPRLAIIDYLPREISVLVRRAPREEE